MKQPSINSRWKDKESGETVSVGFLIYGLTDEKEYVTFRINNGPKVTFLPVDEFMEKYDAIQNSTVGNEG